MKRVPLVCTLAFLLAAAFAGSAALASKPKSKPAINTVELPVASASAKTRSITVAATDSSFVNTGVVLAQGGSVEVTVSGDGRCGSGCHPGDAAGEGDTCETRALGALSPGPAGPNQEIGIYGRFGQGKIFKIGHGGTFKGVGELSVVYNDCAEYYGDNSGSFTVKVTYQGAENGLSISFDPATAAPATGVSTVTISDRDDKGNPVSGALIHIEPPLTYGAGNPSALICDDSDRLVYPTHLSPTDILGSSFDRTTDSAGQIHLKVYAGAIGGQWTIDALERGESDGERFFADLNIGAGVNATQLPPELTSLLLAAADSSLGDFSAPVQRTALSWLGGVARGSGALAGVAFAPIYAVDAVGATNPGIVLYADSPGVRKEVLDYLSGANKFAPDDLRAVVIDVRSMAQLLLGTRIAGQKVNATPYRLPSLEQWANGSDIQITDPTVQAQSHSTHIPIPARGRPVLGIANGSPNEDLLYGYGPYPPFGADAQTQAQFAHCLGYTFATTVTPHSPVRLEASGAHGRVAGISAKGKAVDTLPGAIVNYKGSKLRSLQLPSGKSTLKVTGTGRGNATLVLGSGAKTRVFNFGVKRGEKGTIAFKGPAPKTMRWGGKTLRAARGLGLSLKGTPANLRAGRSRTLSLRVVDQFGKPASGVTLRASGAPLRKALHAGTNGSGHVALPVRPRRKGTIRLRLGGVGYATKSLSLKVR